MIAPKTPAEENRHLLEKIAEALAGTRNSGHRTNQTDL